MLQQKPRCILGIAASVMMGFTMSLPAMAETKLDLNTAWPDGNFHAKNAKKFAAEVADATDGNIVINVKTGGQLGFKFSEYLATVRDGLIPLADITASAQAGTEPILGLESLPFVAGSMAELKVFHKYLRPVYENAARRNNQKILYMVPWPRQYLYLNSKVTKIEDFHGLKIRVPDANALKIVKTLGMTGVLIPWGETIPAVATGAVDGVTTSSISGVEGKFWEFLKYAHITDHSWSSQMLTVNLDTWNSLSESDRKTIEGVANKLEPTFWDISHEADLASVKKLEENGVEIVLLPSELLALMYQLTAPLRNGFVEHVPAGEAPLKAFLEDSKK